MKCFKCGYENKEDALYCNLCGEIFKREQAKAPVSNNGRDKSFQESFVKKGKKVTPLLGESRMPYEKKLLLALCFIAIMIISWYIWSHHTPSGLAELSKHYTFKYALVMFKKNELVKDLRAEKSLWCYEEIIRRFPNSKEAFNVVYFLPGAYATTAELDTYGIYIMRKKGLKIAEKRGGEKEKARFWQTIVGRHGWKHSRAKDLTGDVKHRLRKIKRYLEKTGLKRLPNGELWAWKNHVAITLWGKKILTPENIIPKYEQIIEEERGTEEEAWAHYELGLMYVGLHRYLDAIKELEKAREIFNRLDKLSYLTHKEMNWGIEEQIKFCWLLIDRFGDNNEKIKSFDKEGNPITE